ncbi:MAG: hypothetical protein IT183_08920 [Acidobacteria bacterium]|nr:hypothetical protein [Acidobacteriota bacterium]
MTRRFLTMMVVALLLQGTVFAIYYDDLLFLRQPLPQIAAGPVEAFTGHATAALGRRRLTVRHLETIAGGAQAFDLHDMEVTALERRLVLTPGDSAVRLRLADALRRAGRLAEAESIYLDILAASERAHP